ncbi:MAG: UDP-N-acetylmuramoyl-L-alanyl-D-glutamate--2,6-diaminopimelate ligase [Myxococcota bacterium]
MDAETTRGRTLAQLARLIGGHVSPPEAGPVVSVTGVQQDSRRVEPGDLFVARRGAQCDGVAFVSGAARRGAAAVLVEASRVDEVVGAGYAGPLLVSSMPLRRALATVAAEVYGRPSDHLGVVGITGTNGKTTCAHLLQRVLGASRTATVGTLGASFLDDTHPAGLTSPEADETQAILAAVRARGAAFVAMEVSSIALVAERVHGVRFAGALFTNLTRDHLDYHGSMEAYAAAKDMLFFDHAPPVAAINVDDPHGADLCARLRRSRPDAMVVGYGRRRASEADVTATHIAADAAGMSLTVTTRGRVGEGAWPVRLPLVGDHNVDNTLGVLALAAGWEAVGTLAGGEGVAAGVKALAEPIAIPGRLERCDGPGDDVTVWVDYAHTPDALARVLGSVRPASGGARWCVFGCGGDRDRDKRGPMGAAVARAADVAIVTNDNPRGESPENIAAAVVAGLREGGGARYEVILDREMAIQRAIGEATKGDVVVIAGKGHERYQIIGDTTRDFDDRAAARAALADRRRARRHRHPHHLPSAKEGSTR